MKLVRVIENGCWEWIGALNPHGYPQFSLPDGNKGITVRAHRWSYEHFRGAIPEGFDLDHRCHDAKTCQEGRQCPHRRCVNPEHLEPTTDQENVLRTWKVRKPVCEHGHPLVPGNLRNVGKGPRLCKSCHLIGQIRIAHRRIQLLERQLAKIKS